MTRCYRSLRKFEEVEDFKLTADMCRWDVMQYDRDTELQALEVFRSIDVSGDGITNDGFRPQQAYAHFSFTNVTVNGLAVLGSDPRVVEYFRGEVVHGPGAFVEVAQSYEDFRRAMTLKLFRELNDMIVGQLLP